MKAIHYITILSILFLAGCVPSLHQLWTKDTLVYDEAIKGKYQDNKKVWEFVGDPNSQSYELTIYEKKDKLSKLTVHLVQIGDQRFFDFYPSDNAELDCGDWLKMHLISVHMFFKVEQTEPNLMISVMHPDKIRDLLKEKPDLVQHALKKNRILLTDTPENLQKFMLDVLKIEDIFCDPETLEPIREPGPERTALSEDVFLAP